MKVQKIKLENDTQPFWIVVGADYLPIEPINKYLLFLHSIKKSPNTIRTYAYHLKIFWEYLENKNLHWEKFTINSIAYFVANLSGVVDDNVIHLNLEKAKRSARTINQIIIAVSTFFQYQHQLGLVPEIQFHRWEKAFSTHKSFKPLLHHLSKSKKQCSSIFKLREKTSKIQAIESDVIKKVISSCNSLRDKFLMCLLYETGCRIGQALGLRHEDIETFNDTIVIRPRDDNANYARAKTWEENRVCVSKELMKLYCNYYTNEYGDIDSDYVFINLWQGNIGKPMSYNAVITLFQRFSKKLNVHITPHMIRHTHATELLRSGWGMAHVQKRLGHQNIQTTMNTYAHITDQDLKIQYQLFLKRKDKD